MAITRFDHVTVATADVDKKFAFYRQLGFEVLFEQELLEGEVDKGGLVCGDNKINIRESDDPASLPVHLCVVWEGGIDRLLAVMADAGMTPAAGPVPRLGGLDRGVTRGVSVYIRDPDDLVLELISYDPDDIERYPGQTAEERFRAERSVAEAP